MQTEQDSPFRALANMVPQEGVPKYDFLRNLLQGALESPDTAPDSGIAWDFLQGPQRLAGTPTFPQNFTG